MKTMNPGFENSTADFFFFRLLLLHTERTLGLCCSEAWVA